MNEKVSQIVKSALERCGNEYAKSLECALEIIKSDSGLIDEALTEFISARINDVIRGQYSQQRAGSWNAAPMSDSKYRGMVEQARVSIFDMPIHNGTKLRDATLPDVKKTMGFYFEHGKTNITKFIFFRHINDAMEKAKAGDIVTVGACMEEQQLEKFKALSMKGITKVESQLKELRA